MKKEQKDRINDLQKQLQEKADCVDLTKHPGYKFLVDEFKKMTTSAIETLLKEGKETNRIYAKALDDITCRLINFGNPNELENLLYQKENTEKLIEKEEKIEKENKDKIKQTGQHSEI